MSGLALGVVIVEAAEYGGSLSTARLLYAVPGNITSAQSFGPNLLIKQGAKLVDGWMDEFEELPAAARRPRREANPKSGRSPCLSRGPHRASETTRKLYNVLRTDQAALIDSILGDVFQP